MQQLKKFMAALALAAVSTSALAQAPDGRFLSLTPPEGLPVIPVMEGWVANEDGSGEVRAKAWPKGENEPADWTIKVPVKRVHPKGSAGVFAFSPQAQKRVFLDNIKLNVAK